MREPTEQERKDYRYMISIVIDIKRTDGAKLTDPENHMAQEMRVAAEKAIAKVMAKHGNGNSKNLGSAVRTY